MSATTPKGRAGRISGQRAAGIGEGNRHSYAGTVHPGDGRTVRANECPTQS